jgi:hypothetical protein
VPQPARRNSREAALVELQRLHAAIQASRARRGVDVDTGGTQASLTAEAAATRELTRRLQDEGTELRPAQAEGRSSRRLWWIALAAAAVIGGVWAAMTLGRRPAEVAGTTPAPVAVPPSGPAAAPAAGPAASAPEASGPAAQAPAAPAHAIRVTLDTSRPVWLRVIVDGSRAIEREVAAGEHLAYEGDTRIVVRAGDGGGVRASFNGVDRGPLGKDGWPITVPFAIEAASPPASTSPGPAPAPSAAPTPDGPTSPPPG